MVTLASTSISKEYNNSTLNFDNQITLKLLTAQATYDTLKQDKIPLTTLNERFYKTYAETTRQDALSLIDILDKIDPPVYSEALEKAVKFSDFEVAEALKQKGATLDSKANSLTKLVESLNRLSEQKVENK
jgi:acyl-ACP thioesterase